MPRGVYVRTDEYREKLRLAMLRRLNPGSNKSDETRLKIGNALRGRPKSSEFRQKCRDRMRGKPSPMAGRKQSPENIRAMKERLLGENHWNWKGGISSVNGKIRSSAEYASWRKSVFERDQYTCQICGVRGGDIHADHIKPFACHTELRFALENGRTLCVPCHKNTPTYGGKYRTWKRTA